MKDNFLFFSLLLVSMPAMARNSDASSGLFLILLVLGGVYWMLSSFINKKVQERVEEILLKKKDEIEAKERQERSLTTQHAESERAKTAAKAAALLDQIKQQLDDLQQVKDIFALSYIKGRRWLADYIAEAFIAPDKILASNLKAKKNPAHKAADEVRRITKEKKELMAKLKYLEYSLKTYHEYYPVLEQYSEEILNEEATLILDENEDSDKDRVSLYISKEEYQRLGITERNQLALDNWKARKKTSVEIGRMYERFLGYLYEKDGWEVTYFGAIAGLEDMGRDLLCVKNSLAHVVQAKYWAKHKTIHEKHIFQLYGTSILLPLTTQSFKEMQIVPVFAATVNFSEMALLVAEVLAVQVKNINMDRNYPCIKCNINGKDKIYHFPFDQQYDRIRIELQKGEHYAHTVAEAERLGFRRAMRHTNFSV
ncbi:MAG: hypothetical protein IT497_07025 [Ottowia sp.]|nr:hypothetical protein [Ottowia sp.]